MTKEKRKIGLPRLKCPSTKVFKDKKGKRTKRPTPEELEEPGD
jgi:hypothetical protein